MRNRTTCELDGCSAKFKRKDAAYHAYLHECLYCYVCGCPVLKTDFVRHIKGHMVNLTRFTVNIHEDHPGELRDFKRIVEDSWHSDDNMFGLKKYIEHILTDES